MFSFNAIILHTAIKGETHKSRVTVTESYISMSVFANILAKASNFFLLLFPFSWKYAGI